MIKLIVGIKGSGKTKRIADMANTAVKESKGSVVFVEKGTVLTYSIDRNIRLVDIEGYEVKCFTSLYGFLCGLCAGNYDITDIFVDATFKIGGRDYEAFAAMIDRLADLNKKAETTITFAVSCDPSELPERIKQYII